MSGILGDVQLISQTILCYCIILFGLLCAIPVGITTGKFRGECILYADVIQERIKFGRVSNCNYVTYIHVLLSIFYGGFLAAFYTFASIRRCRQQDLKILKSFILNMVLLVLNALSSFLSLIAACVISVGFSRWCDSLIVNAKVFYGFNIQDLSCSQFQQADWKNVDGSSFHECFTLAIAACWLGTFAWVCQTGFNALTFLRERRQNWDPGSPSSTGSQSATTGIVSIEKY